MVDNYTIYVVNESTSKRKFYCFLDKPESLDSAPEVFANSDAFVNIASQYTGKNKFVIPVQYKINAGCSNQAVGLSIQIQAENPADVDLGQTWEATYYDPSETQGPEVANKDISVDPGQLKLSTSPFKKDQEKQYDWYSNLSFGKQTDKGFIGFTWSPEPNTDRIITPKTSFYIKTGELGKNILADWKEISRDAAIVSEFDEKGMATVTLQSDGTWLVEKGAPPLLVMMGVRGTNLSDEDVERTYLTYLTMNDDQVDTIESVVWDNANLAADPDMTTFLRGSLTVANALRASFTYFILSGVEFQVAKNSEGKSTFSFSYSGDKSAKSVQALFTKGAKIGLGGAKS